MSATPNGLTYPNLTDQPNGPGQLQALAESVDARYGANAANYAALSAIGDPYPGMRIWLNDRLGHAVYNGSKWIAPEFYVAKTADETVTNTVTLQDDNHLAYNVPGAGEYTGDLYLDGISSANNGGDLRVAFTFPNGTLNAAGMGPDSNLPSGTVQTTQFGGFLAMTSGVTAFIYGLSTSVNGVWIHFQYTATDAGNLKVQWAQGNASGSSTLKAGSHLIVKNRA